MGKCSKLILILVFLLILIPFTLAAISGYNVCKSKYEPYYSDPELCSSYTCSNTNTFNVGTTKYFVVEFDCPQTGYFDANTTMYWYDDDDNLYHAYSWLWGDDCVSDGCFYRYRALSAWSPGESYYSTISTSLSFSGTVYSDSATTSTFDVNDKSQSSSGMTDVLFQPDPSIIYQRCQLCCGPDMAYIIAYYFTDDDWSYQGREDAAESICIAGTNLCQTSYTETNMGTMASSLSNFINSNLTYCSSALESTWQWSNFDDYTRLYHLPLIVVLKHIWYYNSSGTPQEMSYYHFHTITGYDSSTSNFELLDTEDGYQMYTLAEFQNQHYIGYGREPIKIYNCQFSASIGPVSTDDDTDDDWHVYATQTIGMSPSASKQPETERAMAIAASCWDNTNDGDYDHCYAFNAEACPDVCGESCGSGLNCTYGIGATDWKTKHYITHNTVGSQTVGLKVGSEPNPISRIQGINATTTQTIYFDNPDVRASITPTGYDDDLEDDYILEGCIQRLGINVSNSSSFCTSGNCTIAYACLDTFNDTSTPDYEACYYDIYENLCTTFCPNAGDTNNISFNDGSIVHNFTICGEYLPNTYNITLKIGTFNNDFWNVTTKLVSWLYISLNDSTIQGINITDNYTSGPELEPGSYLQTSPNDGIGFVNSSIFVQLNSSHPLGYIPEMVCFNWDAITNRPDGVNVHNEQWDNCYYDNSIDNTTCDMFEIPDDMSANWMTQCDIYNCKIGEDVSDRICQDCDGVNTTQPQRNYINVTVYYNCSGSTGDELGINILPEQNDYYIVRPVKNDCDDCENCYNFSTFDFEGTFFNETLGWLDIKSDESCGGNKSCSELYDDILNYSMDGHPFSPCKYNINYTCTSDDECVSGNCTSNLCCINLNQSCSNYDDCCGDYGCVNGYCIEVSLCANITLWENGTFDWWIPIGFSFPQVNQWLGRDIGLSSVYSNTTAPSEYPIVGSCWDTTSERTCVAENYSFCSVDCWDCGWLGCDYLYLNATWDTNVSFKLNVPITRTLFLTVASYSYLFNNTYKYYYMTWKHANYTAIISPSIYDDDLDDDFVTVVNSTLGFDPSSSSLNSDSLDGTANTIKYACWDIDGDLTYDYYTGYYDGICEAVGMESGDCGGSAVEEAYVALVCDSNMTKNGDDWQGIINVTHNDTAHYTTVWLKIFTQFGDYEYDDTLQGVSWVLPIPLVSNITIINETDGIQDWSQQLGEGRNYTFNLQNSTTAEDNPIKYACYKILTPGSETLTYCYSSAPTIDDYYCMSWGCNTTNFVTSSIPEDENITITYGVSGNFSILNNSIYKTKNYHIYAYVSDDKNNSDLDTKTFRFNGNCIDSLWTDSEDATDYGGSCGTCFDKQLSPYLNETKKDYGGKCGQCIVGVTKSQDYIWSSLDKTDYKDNPWLYNTKPITPNSTVCQEQKHAIEGGAFIMMLIMMIILIIITIIILIIIIIIIVILFVPIIRFAFVILIKKVIKRRFKKDEKIS